MTLEAEIRYIAEYWGLTREEAEAVAKDQARWAEEQDDMEEQEEEE